jgi:hypothetical protein
MYARNQYLQGELVENGGTDRAKKETKKQCEVVGNALVNFDGLLSLLRTPHQDLTPAMFAQARQYSKKGLELWRILNIKVTPKAHGVEDHACDQLEYLLGLADFCEDWVERLHQLGLKNNRRTRTISNRKYRLYTKWEQISGNREVQSIKTSIHSKRKRELTRTSTLEQLPLSGLKRGRKITVRKPSWWTHHNGRGRMHC